MGTDFLFVKSVDFLAKTKCVVEVTLLWSGCLAIGKHVYLSYDRSEFEYDLVATGWNLVFATKNPGSGNG